MPPTDPRFLNATPEEMETDYWAHYYTENPNALNVVSDDPDFDMEAIASKIEAGDWEDI